MKKNFLQDVIPANHRRSIRDIPLPTHKEKKRKIDVASPAIPHPKIKQTQEDVHVPEQSPVQNHNFNQKEEIFDPQQLHASQYAQDTIPEEQNLKEDQYYEPIKTKKKSGFFSKIIAGIIIGFLAFGGFMISRTQATVVIYPKQDTYDVDITVPTDVQTVATKTQITKTVSKSLEATSEQQVERQANGRIKIINYHAETSQELVKNTRFQTPDGLIYQIRESIEIPGYTTQNGQIIPGTLEVDVYASSAGEEYNIGKTKFTIPGFQGREQFEKITAESITEMTGGFIGIKKVVSETAMEETEEELREQLQSQFSQEPMMENDTIILPNPETITYGELRDEVSGNTVTLTLTATVDAYSFEKQNLFNFVGQNTIGGSTTSDAFSVDVDRLNFDIEGSQIDISGRTDITWKTDIEKLKDELAGKKRSEIGQIVNSYSSFSKADVDLKPFWKSKFPTDPTKINVEVAN